MVLTNEMDREIDRDREKRFIEKYKIYGVNSSIY